MIFRTMTFRFAIANGKAYKETPTEYTQAVFTLGLDYDRIKYEMGSHQLITVPGYNWITITLNNPLGLV